ncbi:MAG TPA: O-antigen ligase family protein, partial [Mariprofundaceae bacterium]|nr:O-antigen ligase family protein [Mariprofundaceae bacterium]
MQTTWHNLQAIQRGDMSSAGPRWSLWVGALDAWRMHPVLGVGTGGFPVSSTEVAKLHPELNYGGLTGHVAAHPHNMYLLALARWSVWGVAALLLLIYAWVRTGWRMDWRAETGGLVALSGLALAVHGLTSPSLEEHFEGVLAMLLLSTGLVRDV